MGWVVCEVKGVGCGEFGLRDAERWTLRMRVAG